MLEPLHLETWRLVLNDRSITKKLLPEPTYLFTLHSDPYALALVRRAIETNPGSCSALYRLAGGLKNPRKLKSN